MNIQLRKIQAQDCIPLRHMVLRVNHSIEACIFLGDELKSTFHLGAFLNNNLIGIVSLMNNYNSTFKQNQQYQLRGMAIHPNYHSKGVGKKLLQFSLDNLTKINANLCWCNAREKAVEFYKKNGFQVKGSKFSIPEIGAHYLMFKQLD